jgi:hypothetical protein
MLPLSGLASASGLAKTAPKTAENASGRYIDNKRPPSYLSQGLASKNAQNPQALTADAIACRRIGGVWASLAPSDQSQEIQG